MAFYVSPEFRELSFVGIPLESANKELSLIDHLRREMVMKQDEQLLVAHHLELPLVAVNRLKLIKSSAKEVEPLPVDVLKVRCPADGRLLAHGAAAHTVDDPLQNTHVLAIAR